MGLLTRDQILEAPDAVVETVEVPEWGGSVNVRGLSAAERDQYEQETFVASGNEKASWIGARARLVVRTLVDEKGQRLFTKGDIDRLGQKSAVALNRVWEVAMSLSGMSKRDIGELLKNSEGDPEDSSPSD